jgi:hypothetical protein
MRFRIELAVAALCPFVMLEASAQETAGDSSVAEPDAPPAFSLAPSGAFELQFNAGYVQPFGELSNTVDMGDFADAGFTGGGALAWRLTPSYAVVGYGGFGHWVADDRLAGGSVFGGAGGLAAGFHFLPHNLVDPVLQVGAGYRLLFVAPGDERDNHMLHGFQVLRTDFVLDFRLTEDFALGPMLSADINVLPWDLDTTTGTNTAIDEPRVSTFFFAGVAGRHDLLGARVAKGQREPAAATSTASNAR